MRIEKNMLSQPAESTENNKTENRRAVTDVCYIGVFVAIIAVCAQIAIYVGEIPYTLQTLAVCLAAGLLGLKRGVTCVFVYVLMGIFGIPVFSGYKNFYALIGGASAGYVVGFVFTAGIVGFTSDRLRKIGDKTKNKTASQIIQLAVLVLSMVIGVVLCYAFGTLWFMFVYKGSVTTQNLQIALAYCVYPYVIADAVKIAVAAILVNRLKRYVKE